MLRQRFSLLSVATMVAAAAIVTCVMLRSPGGSYGGHYGFPIAWCWWSDAFVIGQPSHGISWPGLIADVVIWFVVIIALGIFVEWLTHNSSRHDNVTGSVLFLTATFIVGAIGEVAASELKDDELEVIKAANGNSQLQLATLTIDKPSTGFGLLVEGYKGGEATEFKDRSSEGWSPPEQGVAVKICVCLQNEQSPQRDQTKRNRPSIPGTGSVRLGYAYRIRKSGTQASSVVVSNSTFDLYEAHVVKCKELPFTIVNHRNKTCSVLVVAIFPRKFDVRSLKGDVDALSLPDGTLVVYAAIKRPD
jgi:hypothetical protein